MKSSGFQMKSLLEYIKTQPPGQPLQSVRKRKQKPATAGKKAKPYKKQKISQALREQVWIQRNGKVFQTKCMVTWCKNTVTVFDFQCGHDIPESKGGPTKLENLYPICGKCNLSMSNTYTFKEWCKLYEAREENKPSVPSPTLPPPSPPPVKKSFWTWILCKAKQ